MGALLAEHEYRTLVGLVVAYVYLAIQDLTPSSRHFHTSCFSLRLMALILDIDDSLLEFL